MSDRLSQSAAWNRARALKLHEHFQSAALALQAGAKIGDELTRILRLLNGLPLSYPGGEMRLTLSWRTINREWANWKRGGREGREVEAHICRAEALLCAYVAGCGGHKAMPRLLIKELHRRMTLTTGGRDKHKRSPLSKVWEGIAADYKAQRPLPGVDYNGVPMGAEIPWTYSTACRRKAGRTLRALGNLGASAAKNISAYVSLDYSRLRKCELYTLDDVRLDIVCIDEATGRAIEVVLYVFMEVASRMVVGYVMKPAAAIKQEDVDELLAHMLQVPGFGIGIGYVTHILFERGTVACSDAAKALLEGVTDGRLKVHQTGMVGGVRWVGAARDKARGNAAGKAVIESFNRSLHYSLLHLPGQRGNEFTNQPQNLGDMGGANFFSRPAAGASRQNKGTLIDQAEQLAQFEIASGRRVKLKLPMLRLFELNEAVRDAIKRHNTEPGHEYRGHGEFLEEEVAPNLWQDTGACAPVRRASTAHTAELITNAQESGNGRDGAHPSAKALDGVHPDAGVTPRSAPVSGVRQYVLKTSAAPLAPGQRNGLYWSTWKQVEALSAGHDRFALTRRTLGCVPKVSEMTDDQLRKIVAVFAAIVREAKAPEVDQPF